MQNKYQEYQKYVKEKIDALNVIFANAAIGDFSHNVEVPEEDDMFLQLYVGVQTMLEVIRTQLREMHTLNHSLERRVNERTLTLIEAEKRYRAVLESAPDALVIVDQTGTITIVNSQTEQMFGYRREELIGQTIEMLLPEQLRKKHAGYRLEFMKEMRTREMGAGLELFALKKDGKGIPIEISLSPVNTEQGIIVIAAIRDITERKKVQRQIQMLAHTIRSMNECVIITDLNNIILSANPAMVKTYGYSAQELIGKNISLIRSESDTDILTQKILFETLQKGWEGEVINRKKNGEEFPVYLSTSVVRDESRIPIALVGIARDITESKRLRQQLEDAARQRENESRYFSVSIQRAQEEERRRIARELHDGLSQRLSGMKLHLELLASEVSPDDKKIAQRIKKIKTQINEMINETHRISVNLHPTTLDDFGLTVALQLLFKEFEATFSIPVKYYPSITTHEQFDRYIEIALYRITQEALNNISKYAKATVIIVRFTRDNAGFILSIEDNGVGFDPKSLKVKANSTRGLGLISMKERTEHVGGKFEIASELHRGTKILVTIPVKK